MQPQAKTSGGSPGSRFGTAPKWIAVGVALFVGWKVVDVVAIQPISKRCQQIRALTREQNKSIELASQAEVATQYIHRNSSACISADPAVVAHRYRQWLIGRAAGSPTINITPGPPVPEGDIGWKVTIQIEGSAEIDWIARTIDALDRTPLMHRIAYVSINASEAGSADFVLSLEALAIHGAGEVETWPGTDEQPAPILASFLHEREPFKRGYTGPPPKLVSKVPQAKKTSETSVSKPAPTIDRLATLRVVGSVSIDSQKQAWLVDSRTGQEILVAEGGQFKVGAYLCRVAKISGDYIQVSLKPNELPASRESAFRWPLGYSLRDAMQ